MEWIGGWIFSVVRVYNAVFDEIPSIQEIQGLSVLPLVEREIEELKSRISEEEYSKLFEQYLQTPMFIYKKDDYPQKYLTYIFREEIGKYQFTYTAASLSWERNGMDDWLSEFYLDWKDVIINGKSRYL